MSFKSCRIACTVAQLYLVLRRAVLCTVGESLPDPARNFSHVNLPSILLYAPEVSACQEFHCREKSHWRG